MIQFAIFYIGVNINSFVMVFQKYDINEITERGSYEFLFKGAKSFSDIFENFSRMSDKLSRDNFDMAIKNSLLAFVFITLVGIIQEVEKD